MRHVQGVEGTVVRRVGGSEVQGVAAGIGLQVVRRVGGSEAID